MEYQLFGEFIMRRQDADHEWESVPEDGIADAVAAMDAEAQATAVRRAEGAGFRTRTTRAPRNVEIAAKLGLSADELAERLATPDANDGTRLRIDDAEFDALMGELGIGPDEARARLRGTFWN